MKVVQLGPTWIPHWLIKFASGIMFRHQDRDLEQQKAAGAEDHGVCTMRGLGGLIRYDFTVAEGMIMQAARYGDLESQFGERILLLTGSRSPEYLRQGMATLDATIPGARLVTIDGVGHEVLCGAEMRGNPAKAIPAILIHDSSLSRRNKESEDESINV
jgi:hypothetical protein